MGIAKLTGEQWTGLFSLKNAFSGELGKNTFFSANSFFEESAWPEACASCRFILYRFLGLKVDCFAGFMQFRVKRTKANQGNLFSVYQLLFYPVKYLVNGFLVVALGSAVFACQVFNKLFLV